MSSMNIKKTVVPIKLPCLTPLGLETGSLRISSEFLQCVLVDFCKMTSAG